MGFKEMKMMKSTEPSVDEVGKGMKKGGKPKMQMGGALPVAETARRKRPGAAEMVAAMRPRGASLMRSQALSRPGPGMPPQALGRVKDGGSIRNEKDEIRRVKDELKSNRKEERNEHEEIGRVKKELKQHESMKASKAHKGLKTGGVLNGQGGYKKGGDVAKYATGGLIQKYKTGGVVNGAAGYKDGGHCAMKEGGEAGFKANKKSCSW